MLPPSLQRQPMRRPVPAPTDYDQSILQEAWAWKVISEHGGIKTCCRIPELGAPVYDNAPWLQMPGGGIPFRNTFSLPTASFQASGVYTGLDTLLADPNGNTYFQVPFGWDGVITSVINAFTGTGFQEFSGNVIWRVKVGQRFAKSLGNIINQYGSFQVPVLSPSAAIRMVSGQSVQLFGNIPSTSPVAGGWVSAGVSGWFYPRR